MNIIFITYQNRSGSTFLANQLSRHEDILVCPEAEILVSLFLLKPKELFNLNNSTNIENQLLNDFKFKNWNLKSVEFEFNTNFENFLKILNQYKQKAKPNATIIVFKSDLIIDLVDKIHYLNIKYISLIRDPRAVFLSQKTTIGSWNKPMETNAITSAICWNSFTKKSILFNIDFPEFIIIKYEDLISNFKDEIGLIFEFIFNRQISIKRLKTKGDLFNRLPESHKNIHQNIDKEPIIENIDKWKNELSNYEIAIIQKIAKKSMRKFNYKLSIVNYQFSDYLKFTNLFSAYLFKKMKKIIKK